MDVMARIDKSNETLLENIVLDGSSRSKTGKAILEELLKTITRTDSSLALAKACLLLPKGKTGFYKSKKKDFVLVIKKQGEANFLVTVRGGKAAVSFNATVKESGGKNYFEIEKVRSFLGVVADINSVIRKAAYSAQTRNHDISRKLKTVGKKAPFLGVAGHENSPERAYVTQLAKTEKLLWTARPA